MSEGADLSESLCWEFAWFLGKGRGTEESQVLEHRRYPLEEPLVEQGRGAELWSGASKNGSGKKQRRKSREMIMFPQAHPSRLTRSTKINPKPTGKAAWVEETHLAKMSLSHPTFHGNVALCMPQVPPSSSPRLWGELAPRATTTLK